MITGQQCLPGIDRGRVHIKRALDQQVCRRGIGILQIGKAGPCQRLQSWIRQRRARLELALRELRRRREEVAIPEVIV